LCIRSVSAISEQERKHCLLFDTTVANISMHLTSIFENGELSEDSVVKDFLITAADAKAYNTKHYSLIVVIPLGY